MRTSGGRFRVAVEKGSLRIVLVLVLLFLVSFGVWGQVARPLSLSVGVRGGSGVTGMLTQPHLDIKGSPLYFGGVSLRLTQHRFVALVVEVNYVSSSYQADRYSLAEYLPQVWREAWSGKSWIAYDHQWIQLPMLLQLHYEWPWFTLQLTAGGGVDYLVSERVRWDGSEFRVRSSYLPATHRPLGVSFIGGGAVGWRSQVHTVLLEYRFQYRYTNLFREVRVPGGVEPASHPLLHQVGLAYYYTFNPVESR